MSHRVALLALTLCVALLSPYAAAEPLPRLKVSDNKRDDDPPRHDQRHVEADQPGSADFLNTF